eukprot:SAG25_NODE_2035_length_2008_cov_1.285490_1_plen_97_part_00
MALQKKNKLDCLGDIIVGVMGQRPVPFSVEVTVPLSRHETLQCRHLGALEKMLPQPVRGLLLLLLFGTLALLLQRVGARVDFVVRRQAVVGVDWIL